MLVISAILNESVRTNVKQSRKRETGFTDEERNFTMGSLALPKPENPLLPIFALQWKISGL